ncbi:MAG: hypothetical protein LBU58_10740, partial [Clostridiales bacterium]|nr:hypothetical protein [Clostridiales bacterium]
MAEQSKNGGRQPQDRRENRAAGGDDPKGCLKIVAAVVAVVGISLLIIYFAPKITFPEMPGLGGRSGGTGGAERSASSDAAGGSGAPSTATAGAGTTARSQTDAADKTADEDVDASAPPPGSVGDQQTAQPAFDERTKADYQELYAAHDKFAAAVEGFLSGEVGESALREACEEANVWFLEASGRLNYGADEDQRSFLYLFQAAAMSDQIASGAVLRYLDAGELGPL